MQEADNIVMIQRDKDPLQRVIDIQKNRQALPTNRNSAVPATATSYQQITN
jgi:hypothetical protein